jgi:PAS domain S-box-containing protein
MGQEAQGQSAVRAGADQVLRESESMYRRLFDSIADPIVIFDQATKRVLDCNRAMVELYGYTFDELLTMTMLELHPAEERADVDRQINDREDSGPHYHTHLTKSGEALQVEIQTAEFVYRGLAAWLSTIRDQTARQQAEMELVRRNQQLDTINQINHSLNALTEQAEILDLVNSTLSPVFDSRNLAIALYDGTHQRVSFPMHFRDGQRLPASSRALGHDVADYVIRSRTPLLPADVIDELHRLGIDRPDRAARSLLAVPMVTGVNVVGAIILQNYERPDAYTPADLELLVGLAEHTAAALERARLLADVANRAVELQTAAAVSRAASSMLNLDELLPTTVELIRNRFDIYYVGIFLVDDAGEYAVLRAGSGAAGRLMLERGHRLAIGDSSMIGWCIAHRQARIALDVGNEAVRFNNPVLPDTRSELALPLISRGQALGAMSVQSVKEAAFGEVDIAALQNMADQIANAIANARLFVQEQTIRASTEMLYQMSTRLNAATALDEMLQAAIAPGVAGGAATAALWRFDRDASGRPEWMEFAATWVREGQPGLPIGTRLRVAEYPASHIWLDNPNEPALIHDMAADERIDPAMAAAFEQLGVQAAVFMPLTLSGRWVGLVIIAWNAPHEFSAAEQDLYRSIATQAATAVNGRLLFEQTQTALAEASRLARREELVNRISARIRAAIGVDDVLRIATDELRQATHAARARVRLGASGAASGYSADGNGDKPD